MKPYRADSQSIHQHNNLVVVSNRCPAGHKDSLTLPVILDIFGPHLSSTRFSNPLQVATRIISERFVRQAAIAYESSHQSCRPLSVGASTRNAPASFDTLCSDLQQLGRFLLTRDGECFRLARLTG